MCDVARLDSGEREFVEERDPGCQEFVLLFDHNKRAIIAYDGEDCEFMVPPEEWLDKPLETVMSKETAMMMCIKSREALEHQSIVEYSDIATPGEKNIACYFRARVIPDGPGMCLFHILILSTFLIN